MNRWTTSLPQLLPEASKILLLKWSAMGDVVICTAAFDDVATSFPKSQLHLSTTVPWNRLFSYDPRFSKVNVFESAGAHAGVAGLFRWARAVARERYDAILDFQSNDHSHLAMVALKLVGALPRFVAGYRRRWPYTIAAPPAPAPVHAGTYASSLLAAAGIEARTMRPVVHVDPLVRERARNRRVNNGLSPGRYAVFLPGCQAAGYLKRWGVARYAALAKRLVGDCVDKVVLLGGPAEVDDCAAIARAAPMQVVNLCGQTELLEVVSLCEGARFIVGNDTGTAHLASATGRPLCVICGPTDPVRVKPLGENVTSCQANIACRNCYRKHCQHQSCMSLLTPAEVHEQLLRVL